MGTELIRYKVKEVFTTRVLGSAPADKKVYEEFIAKKKAEHEEKKKKFAERHNMPVTENVGTMEEEIGTVNEDAGVTCFHRDLGQKTEAGEDGQGLFFYDYQIAGFWKEAGEVLQELHGVKQVRSKLDNLMIIDPRCVYIHGKDGKILTEPAGKLERPLRAQTMRGPRVTLACSEVLDPGCWIEYEIELYPFLKRGTGKEAKKIDHDQFLELLVGYGKRKGRGQWRNGGNGRFTAEMTRIK